MMEKLDEAIAFPRFLTPDQACLVAVGCELIAGTVADQLAIVRFHKVRKQRTMERLQELEQALIETTDQLDDLDLAEAVKRILHEMEQDTQQLDLLNQGPDPDEEEKRLLLAEFYLGRLNADLTWQDRHKPLPDSVLAMGKRPTAEYVKFFQLEQRPEMAARLDPTKTGPKDDDVRLEPITAALVRLLADKAPVFKHGEKPNLKQIAEHIAPGLEERGKGYSVSSIRDILSRVIKG